MDAAHFEKTLSSEVLFEGRVVTLTKDVALLENGETSIREVVHHHGGACIVPYFEDGTLCMVRQFRYAMQQELWELPAGKLEKGEDPRDSGLRELREETGLIPGVFESMGVSYSSPGILAERIYLYFAKDLKQGPTQPDDGEFVETVWIPYPELMDMARRGEIVDGKTLAGLLKASFLLGN